ncbi:MAG: hypothetical protein WD604_15385 [Balneolaceae bacterium]
MRQLINTSLVLLSLYLISCSDSGIGSDPITFSVTVDVTPIDGGSIAPSIDNTYEEGEEIELQAIPNDEYLFKNWTGDIESSNNPLTIKVDHDYEITANFELKTYQLLINTEGDGSVSEEILEEKSKDYEHGTIVELTANPAAGYKFVEWLGDITGSENPAQITVDEPKEVTAVFEKKKYELTVNTEGEGAVSEEIIQQKTTDYEYGTVVELTANPDDGWQFVEWQGAISGSENPFQLTVDESKEVTAVFEEKPTELEGIISSNTTLSLTDSPYQLTGKVQIAYGTVLNIDEGVKLYGEGNAIEVFGELLIQGSSSSKVFLENVHIQPGVNQIDELYHIDINFVDIIGGELYSPTGGSIYGSITVKNSFLYKVNRSNFTETYMYIWYPRNDCYIENNIFYNSGRIDTGHSEANVYVANNLFFRSQELSQETGYAVHNWRSTENSKTILRKNTFANIDGVAVSLRPGSNTASIDASENYWSTTSTDIIEDMIFDKNDDLSINEVIPFDPFLNNPDNDTPILPDSLR